MVAHTGRSRPRHGRGIGAPGRGGAGVARGGPDRAADRGGPVASAARPGPRPDPPGDRKRRAAPGPAWDRHARGGDGRGSAGGVRRGVSGARRHGGAGCRPARIFRRGVGRSAVRVARCGRPARGGTDTRDALVLAATDPANPYGAALPWPERVVDAGDGERSGHRPGRKAGALVVTVGGDLVSTWSAAAGPCCPTSRGHRPARPRREGPRRRGPRRRPRGDVGPTRARRRVHPRIGPRRRVVRRRLPDHTEGPPPAQLSHSAWRSRVKLHPTGPSRAPPHGAETSSASRGRVKLHPGGRVPPHGAETSSTPRGRKQAPPHGAETSSNPRGRVKLQPAEKRQTPRHGGDHEDIDTTTVKGGGTVGRVDR